MNIPEQFRVNRCPADRSSRNSLADVRGREIGTFNVSGGPS
jgi:hypothetical protein